MNSPRLFDLSARTQLELTGDDRAAFLHNLCTNDIRKLAAGSGCEAFLLDARGHILGLVWVFCRPQSLVIDMVPGQASALLAHLDRYLIREKVELHDRSAQWAELLVDGPGAAEAAARVAGDEVWINEVDWTGAGGRLVSCPRERFALLRDALADAGCVLADAASFNAARLEAGTPLWGVDISEKNLPQEVARDARAISFVKGCYLGQETVARIDALGHVNKTLCGVQFGGSEIPRAGTALAAGGRPAGEVTSAAWSPRLRAPLALAWLRRGTNTPGTRLDSPLGPAQVVALPLE